MNIKFENHYSFPENFLNEKMDPPKKGFYE